MKSLTGKSESLPPFTNELAKVNMTTKELLDELEINYADYVRDDIAFDVYKSVKDNLIKELEASIRKEVVEDILKMEQELNVDGNIFEVIAPHNVKEYALSKGITLK